MRTTNPIRFICLFVACCALSSIFNPVAHADGGGFPPAAIRKFPEIPRQRAVLSWRDGMEGMVVETTFKSESDTLGWVIPLPSVPAHFTAESPGYIGEFSRLTNPWVTHERSIHEGLDQLLGVAVLILLMSILIFRPGRTPAILLILNLAWMGLFVCAALTPIRGRSASAGAGARAAHGVILEKQAVVGNYTVEVVKAATPESLSDWLAAAGFVRLPERGKKIIAGLIKDGWCFVAARLKRAGQGVMRPHPLSLTFPAKKMIYPMRLTALAESTVNLDLYVLAEQRASCPLLKMEFCGQNVNGQFKDISTALWPYHYDLNDKPYGLWAGCTVTRLTGPMLPARMDRDLTFQWQTPMPYRKEYYSRVAACNLALSLVVPVWCLLMVVIMLGYATWPIPVEADQEPPRTGAVTVAQDKWQVVERWLNLAIFPFFLLLITVVVFYGVTRHQDPQWLPLAFGGFGLTIFLALVVATFKKLPPEALACLHKERRRYQKICLGLLAVFALLGGSIYAYLPKTDIVELPHGHMVLDMFERSYTEIMDAIAIDHKQERLEDLRHSYDKALHDEEYAGPYIYKDAERLGMTIKEGNEPGNYEIYEAPDGSVECVLHLFNGDARRILIREKKEAGK